MNPPPMSARKYFDELKLQLLPNKVIWLERQNMRMSLYGASCDKWVNKCAIVPNPVKWYYEIANIAILTFFATSPRILVSGAAKVVLQRRVPMYSSTLYSANLNPCKSKKKRGNPEIYLRMTMSTSAPPRETEMIYYSHFTSHLHREYSTHW